MGYVTVKQLEEKYGAKTLAALAYLKGTLDQYEREAVEQRLNPTHILFAKMMLLDEKLDLLLSCRGR